MATGLVFDDCFRGHDTGGVHPERAERLDAVWRGLESAGLVERCSRLPVREASDDELGRVHDLDYVRRLERTCDSGAAIIDTMDNPICKASYRIARMAAGSVLAAVDAVMAGDAANAFCAVRPPGHHCERDRAMGFCLLANVAIAAQHLIDHHGLDRVAVIDWDVHHGNGTQHLFEETASVFVCSLHGHPEVVYPGTGYEYERGRGDGAGATLNICMQPGSGDDAYRVAFETRVLPAIDDYRPQFVLISAGFDAHHRDPLAPINLESESFGWMTRAVLDVARQHCGSRVVSTLEGGYDLDALAESSAIHVGELVRAATPAR